MVNFKIDADFLTQLVIMMRWHEWEHLSTAIEFKRVKNGLGVAIVSTSKGVMTDKEAKAQNVGGEVLCNIY